MSAVAEKLGALGVAVRSARAEAERTERAIAAAEAALDSDRTDHAGLAERYEAAGVQPDSADADVSTRRARPARRRRLRRPGTRDRAAAGAADPGGARAARCTTGPPPSRRRPWPRSTRGPARRRDDSAGSARPRWPRRSAWAPHTRPGLLSRAADQADALRRRAEEARTARDAELAVLRREVATLQEELRELTDSVHRDEVARTQQRLRIEQLETRAVEELGVDPATLVEEYGPHQLVPQAAGRGERRARRAAALRARGPGEAAARPASDGSPRSAGSTRSRWRSSPRWRSGIPSSPRSWRTSSGPSATCSTSSARSTSGSSGSSPRPTTTWRCSSSASSAGCSPAARAG